MGRALIFGGGRVLAVLVTATGLGFDLSGISLLGFSTIGVRIMVAVAFASFVILTVYREVELYLQPRPKVEFDALSPAKAIVTTRNFADGTTAGDWGYFYRIAFRNNARSPSGANSTANAMTASISIFLGDKLQDSWDGRWAANDEPRTYPEKFKADRIDLPANNQQAILDIGMRLNGKTQFQGWDNGRYLLAQPRAIIAPGVYRLQVVLAASNFPEKELWFTLSIPDVPQFDKLDQIEIKRIKKPAIHKEGSQT
jgi:hypothetical protein